MITLRLFAAAAALTLATGAQAGTVTINNYSFTNGKETGTLNYAPSQFNNQSLYIGGFTLTGTDNTTGKAASFDTFCVDVTRALTLPNTYTVVPLSQLFSAATATKLSTLMTNAAFKPTNATTSAALQMAIWETIYETSTTKNVTSNVFAISGGSSAAARTLGNTYLSQVSGLSQAPNTRVQLLFSNQTQSQIFASAAPEPAAWAMFIIGFGATGAVLRRTRRVTARCGVASA